MRKRAHMVIVLASSARSKSTHDRMSFLNAMIYNTQDSSAETPHSRKTTIVCRRFRIPYEFFLELVKSAKQVVRLAATDVAGRQSIPLELNISRRCC